MASERTVLGCCEQLLGCSGCGHSAQLALLADKCRNDLGRLKVRRRRATLGVNLRGHRRRGVGPGYRLGRVDLDDVQHVPDPGALVEHNAEGAVGTRASGVVSLIHI